MYPNTILNNANNYQTLAILQREATPTFEAASRWGVADDLYSIQCETIMSSSVILELAGEYATPDAMRTEDTFLYFVLCAKGLFSKAWPGFSYDMTNGEAFHRWIDGE